MRTDARVRYKSCRTVMEVLCLSRKHPTDVGNRVRRVGSISNPAASAHTLGIQGRRDVHYAMGCLGSVLGTFAWEKLCAKIDIGLKQGAEADELFEDLASDEVNDFIKVVLETTFRVERIQIWFVSSRKVL
ncbi:hypothetical protein HD806DRAFT_337596 [Xylariaceae sp. AK1471]|nr:hypothetical protein HD806DRAFT_337596 [Xylariaceae sp. AK1471]